MVADWKLELMAKEVMNHIWGDKKSAILFAVDLIKKYYKEGLGNQQSVNNLNIRAKLDKSQERIKKLIEMRADGEISKEEYQSMRQDMEDEISSLQARLNESGLEGSTASLDLNEIISVLNQVVDLSGSKIDHNLIDQFVYKVTPVENDTFYWFINMNGKGDVRAKLTANGYKANCSIQLEEIERISSLHKDQSPKIVSWEKSPLLTSVLHRLLSTIRSNLIIDFQKGCHAKA